MSVDVAARSCFNSGTSVSRLVLTLRGVRRCDSFRWAVPFRFVGSGRVELACVFREARGDWTFPKGKLDPDETFEHCAVREVWEETGLYCQIERFVGTTNYTHRKGKPKIVAYYLMSVIGGEGLFQPNEEVDELRWIPLEQVRDIMTWDRDQELCDMLMALPELRAQAS